MRGLVAPHSVALVKRLLMTLAGLVAIGCGPGLAADAGIDASAPDAGAPDAGADAGVDAGPSRPRALDLLWSSRVESAQSLAPVESANARLAPMPGGGVALSVTLGGAPAVFAPGAGAITVGDGAMNRVTQALAFYDAEGALRAARAVAVADPVLEGFNAGGYTLGSLADGAVIVGGRFFGGARFGPGDPNATVFATVRQMIEEDVFVTSNEGYLARFDASHAIEWARRPRSETGFAELSYVADLGVLADGSALVLGAYDDPVTLGEGEPSEVRLAPSPGAAREVYLARFAPDGALVWARAIRGQSTPTRIAALADGSSIVLVRYGAAVTFGSGEPAERTIPAPPDGTLECDAIARFDPDGRLVWVRALESDATDYPGLRDLSVEADGSVVVAGTFRGEVRWPDEPAFPPYEAYGAEGLIARLDPSGALLWQRRIRPVNSLSVQAIAPHASGTWVAGTVSMHGAAFNPEGAEALVLEPSSATSRLVLLRYDAEGLLRAAHLAASDDVNADDLLALEGGDLVLVGRYGASTVLEPDSAQEVALPPALAFRNVFLARYAER